MLFALPAFFHCYTRVFFLLIFFGYIWLCWSKQKLVLFTFRARGEPPSSFFVSRPTHFMQIRPILLIFFQVYMFRNRILLVENRRSVFSIVRVQNKKIVNILFALGRAAILVFWRCWKRYYWYTFINETKASISFTIFFKQFRHLSEKKPIVYENLLLYETKQKSVFSCHQYMSYDDDRGQVRFYETAHTSRRGVCLFSLFFSFTYVDTNSA